MFRSRILMALAVVLIVAAACTAQSSSTATLTPMPTRAPAYGPAITNQEQLLIESYRGAHPARGNITVVLAAQGLGAQDGNMAQGSGFLYDAEGRIVTNNHVVDGATRVEVTFADGSTQTARRA